MVRCWRQRRPEGSGGAAASTSIIHPGRATRWPCFDPSRGLGRLRDLIATVASGEGVELTGDVGVCTSHAGDLLRWAVIPSRLATPPRALR
jgi:hypothetical protein